MLLRPKTGLKDMFVELDPGTQAAGELPEGGRIGLSADAARRQPGRDPRAARRRHARVPPDPRQRRRRGVHRRPVQAVRAVLRGRPARDVQALRADQQVPREVHRAPVGAARQRRSARSTASGCWPRSWRRRTRSSPRSSTRRTRTSRSSPSRTQNLQSRAAAVPVHAHDHRDDARQGRAARRRARPELRGAAAVRAPPRPGAGRDRARPARDRADHPRRDPPVRAHGAQPGARAAPRGRAAWRRPRAA